VSCVVEALRLARSWKGLLSFEQQQSPMLARRLPTFQSFVTFLLLTPAPVSTTKVSPVPPPNLLCTVAGVTGKAGEPVLPTIQIWPSTSTVGMRTLSVPEPPRSVEKTSRVPSGESLATSISACLPRNLGWKQPGVVGASRERVAVVMTTLPWRSRAMPYRFPLLFEPPKYVAAWTGLSVRTEPGQVAVPAADAPVSQLGIVARRTSAAACLG